MPLPHFLVLIAVVILLAGLTIWAALVTGVPLAVLGLVALMAVAVVHFAARHHPDHEG